MTIAATPSTISYAGDGVSTVFTIPFKFDTSADLKVIETTAGAPTVIVTGFSIAGGGGSTGTLTRLVALPVGTTITILDDPAQTQPVDYVNNDAFPAETHEKALDRVTRLCKRLSQRVDRSIRVQDGDLSNGDNLLLPIVSTRQGKYMAFDASGQPTVASGTGNDSALRTDLATTTVGVDGSRLVGFRRTETGSVAESVWTMFQRQWAAPQDFGAVGDDANNDTAAMLLWAAASRDLWLPGNKIYRIDQELPFTATSPLHIKFGPGAKLKTIGATNRAMHFQGSPAGSTSCKLRLDDPQIFGANSGTALSAIYMDGVALGWIYRPIIEGNSKFTTGIEGDGFQQGGIHDGYITAVTKCIDLYRSADEGFGTIGSNGIEINGISLSALAAGTQIRCQNTDSVMIHDTHSIGSAIGFDLVDLFLGCSVRANHIEGPSAGSFTAAIKVSGATALSNTIDTNFLQGNGVGIWVATGNGHVITNNKLSACGLQLDASVGIEVLTGNLSVASGAPVFTNNASRITLKSGNRTEGTGFDWRDTYSPAQITADQNDYAVPTEAQAVRLSSNASRNITGLANGWANRRIPIMNVGANDLVLKQASGSSAAANRFEIGTDITITPAHAVLLNYDGPAQLWRCVGKY